MQRVEVTQDFTAPVGRVYAHLAEHENLGPVFGARVTRVRDGDHDRNGVGSVRSLRVGPLPAFEETVTDAVPDELVEYRITRGMPLLTDHVGRMRFSARGSGTQLHYVISFGSPVPGVDRLIRAALGRSVRRGLADLARRL